MSDRTEIFSRISDAISTIPDSDSGNHPSYSPTDLVAYPRLTHNDSWRDFAENLSAVGGHPIDHLDDLISLLKKENHTTGFCDPALAPFLQEHLKAADLTLHTTFDHSQLRTYQFCITWATGAIAETGTLIIDDESTCDRLAAITPDLHIVAFHRSQIIPTLPDAIRDLGDSDNIVWLTGSPRQVAFLMG